VTTRRLGGAFLAPVSWPGSAGASAADHPALHARGDHLRAEHPGIALVDDRTISNCSRAGAHPVALPPRPEFSIGDLLAGGRSLLAIGAIYLTLNLGGGLAFGFALDGGEGSADHRGAIGISSSAIVTVADGTAPARESEPAHPGIIVVEDVPGAVPRVAATGVEKADGRSTHSGSSPRPPRSCS
jgi:CPA2 family monovalent cation:H+ antiporter-2